VIDLLCDGIDEAFSRDPGLAERFPYAPAATQQKSASLKTYVSVRLGHDRRYAIDYGKIGRLWVTNLDETLSAAERDDQLVFGKRRLVAIHHERQLPRLE
jgi:dTDP-D-glucose 4,6-dehydratase